MDPTLYFIEHLASDTCYIGVTHDIDERFRKHKQASLHNSNKHLASAIKQYGLEQFSFFEVAKYATMQEAYEAEKYWIARFRELNIPLYNFNEGGLGQSPGWSPSKITRERMRLAKSGVKNSFYGKTHTDETRKKLSELHLGKPSPRQGVHLTSVTKEKIRQARLGKTSPKKGQPGCPSKMKGKHFSEEARNNMMKGQRRRRERERLLNVIADEHNGNTE